MKTLDDTKKGLECCLQQDLADCANCPYVTTNCKAKNADALAYIQQLEMLAKPNNQIRWERDIAIDQLNQLGVAFGEKINGVFLEFVDATEELPENEEPVLIVTKWKYFDKEGLATSMAIHTDGKTFTGNSKYDWHDGDADLIYDEENDEYIVPEGWWESVRYSEQFSAVDEPVLYWARIDVHQT